MAVGLGNPGAQYAGTRHNVGFFFIDTLAQLSAADWTAKRGFFADWTKAEDLFLLRPQTFMNNSGRAVAAAAHFWRLSPEQIVVIHDEVDLAPGIAKLKFGGGEAGHNGLRDISRALVTRDYWRLRLGVGKPENINADVSDYVLHRATSAENAAIEQSVEQVLAVWSDFIGGDSEKAMLTLHTKDTPNKKPKEEPKRPHVETATGKAEAGKAEAARKMKLSCGIVGLPNVGKSTLFNALTGGEAATENYPFCTINPNIGLAVLHDERLSELGRLAHSAKIIPAVVEFVDIAGLVAGASDNAGLGNKFLGHIRETAAIIMWFVALKTTKQAAKLPMSAARYPRRMILPSLIPNWRWRI